MKLYGFDVRLKAPDTRISVEDYRRAARGRVPRFVWAYVDEGADTLATLRDNETAFDRWSFRSRQLSGAADPDLTTEIAGVTLDFPVLLAPTGFSGLTRWHGDIDIARAAHARGTRSILSTMSSWSLEEVAASCPAPPFFQLYPGEGDVAGRMMTRAWAAGYRALFVTVDVPIVGNRRNEQRRGMGVPPVMTPRRALDLLRHPVWTYNVMRHGRIGGRNFVAAAGMAGAMAAVEVQHRLIRQSRMSWDDIAWMRERWKGSFYVKGLMEPEDAERAVAVGADGLVVSNHGGRQLDFAAGTLDALPAIVAAVGGRATIMLDGGVRRGGDVVKALALGAKAVLIGRPHLYGLAVGGQAGVEAILDILRREMTGTMRLLGARGVAELDAAWVRPRAGRPG